MLGIMRTRTFPGPWDRFVSSIWTAPIRLVSGTGNGLIGVIAES
jgi:hypothetical protein